LCLSNTALPFLTEDSKGQYGCTNDIKHDLRELIDDTIENTAKGFIFSALRY